MKCQICQHTTTWDTSVGVEEFIVYNSCLEKLMSKLRNDIGVTMNFIFACGYIRRDQEKKRMVKE